MPGVLFVCLGNICRSPLCEGTFQNYLKRENLTSTFFTDSAATSNYHTGEHPHSGGQRCAKGHSFDISYHRARQVKKSDFDKYDLILGMDNSDNMDDLHYMKDKLNPSGKGEVRMLSDFIPNQKHREVPDCYYANDQAACFEEVYKMAVNAIPGIMSHLKEEDSL